jgi:hypothetical protein
MFSKVIPRVKEFYFLPVIFMVPTKAFTGGYEEYIKYKKDLDVPLTQHTFCCFMGAWTGAIGGAFLGATWPISLPIFIGRSIDKSKK